MLFDTKIMFKWLHIARAYSLSSDWQNTSLNVLDSLMNVILKVVHGRVKGQVVFLRHIFLVAEQFFLHVMSGEKRTNKVIKNTL